MSEPVVTKEEVKTPPTLFEEVHDKTIRQILTEPAVVEKKEEVITPPKKEEAPVAPVVDVEQQKKEQEALIARAADEALKRQRESDAREEETKRKQEAAAKAEEPKLPAWKTDPTRPKDKDGNPLPRSYDEIYEEAKTAAKAEAVAEIEKRIAEREQKLHQEQQAQQTVEEQKKQALVEQEKRFNEEISSDLNDLFAMGKLPKIANQNDPNDPGVLARNELFKQGAAINTELLKQGKPPIRSLKLIYYEHYKPVKQPAGGDAPIVNNTPPANTQADDTPYNWAKDHGKSLRQILAEAKAKANRAQ